jgi:hypothetical protein
MISQYIVNYISKRMNWKNKAIDNLFRSCIMWACLRIFAKDMTCFELYVPPPWLHLYIELQIVLTQEFHNAYGPPNLIICYCSALPLHFYSYLIRLFPQIYLIICKVGIDFNSVKLFLGMQLRSAQGIVQDVIVLSQRISAIRTSSASVISCWFDGWQNPDIPVNTADIPDLLIS